MNGLILKQLRKDAKLTQDALAKMLLVTRKTINLYENGSPIPASKAQMIKLIFDKETIEKVTKSDKTKTKETETEQTEMSKLIQSLEKVISAQVKLITQLESENERLVANNNSLLSENEILRRQLGNFQTGSKAG